MIMQWNFVVVHVKDVYTVIQPKVKCLYMQVH